MKTETKKKIVSVFPLIPIIYFMLNLFSMYSLLKPRYPDSPVIWIGIAVTVVVAVIAVLYLVRLRHDR
jgi:hypothetical protein